MRVYDCLLFFGEFDLLKIRLSELNDYVDQFVLIEASHTFTGIPTPLTFKENPITGYNIRHVVIDDLKFPDAHRKQAADAEYLAFFNEWDIKKRGAVEGCSDADATDLILCSDADEIIRPSKIKEGELVGSVMMQEWYLYWLNCKHRDKWPGTSRNLGTPLWDTKYVPNAPRIEDGGWHFSAFGGVEAVKRKLTTGSHAPKSSQFATDDNVESSIMKGEDVFHGLLGNRPMKIGELDDNLPSSMNIEEYEHLIHPDWRENGLRP